MIGSGATTVVEGAALAALEARVYSALHQNPQLASALAQVLDARLTNTRMAYETQVASEFTRGRVLEQRAVLSFLRTGDFANV